MGTALVPDALVGSGLESKSFRGKQVAIRYVEGPPNGHTLVLLHGLSRDWSAFSILFSELVPRFHVFSLDLRGHGQSEHVKHGYRISEMSEDIKEFQQSIVGAPTALFGHSLGAMVGMFAAADNPNISALIVGDSLLTLSNLEAMYDPIFSQLYGLLLRGGSEEQIARGIGQIEIHVPGISEGIRLEELPGNSEAALREWARTAIHTDPECLCMMLDRSAHADWNPESLLPRIACPVLLLQGNPELDALMSDSDVVLAKRLLPIAKHVKFPLLGHALFMQRPKPVLDEVIDFLASIKR